MNIYFRFIFNKPYASHTVNYVARQADIEAACRLISVRFAIKRRLTVHQVLEIAAENLNADTVFITTEICHSIVPFLFFIL